MSKHEVASIAVTHMQHWAILSTYNYNIELKGTKMHANADSLSHLSVEKEDPQKDISDNVTT